MKHLRTALAITLAATGCQNQTDTNGRTNTKIDVVGISQTVEWYRKKFGFHLFGDEEFFNERSRFDLEPLRQIGEDALLCDDVDGIEYVRLKEVQVFWGGAHKDVEIRRSEDIFASLRDRGASLPGGGKIIKASFQIKFEGSKTPRSVILSSGNRAQFKRDGDAEVIERWLGLRGFIVGAGGVSDE